MQRSYLFREWNHELSHFCLAHAKNASFKLGHSIFENEHHKHSDPALRYNYFYTQEDPPRPGKPDPRADSNEIFEKANRFRKNQTNVFKLVPNLSTNPALVGLYVELLNQNTIECASAKELMHNNDFVNWNFLGSMPNETKRAYQEFERGILECSRNYQIGSKAAPRTVSEESVKRAFTSVMRDHLQGPFNWQGQSLFDIISNLGQDGAVLSGRATVSCIFAERENWSLHRRTRSRRFSY